MLEQVLKRLRACAFIVSALALAGVCQSVSAQAQTQSNLRWYRVHVEDGNFSIQRRSGDPVCGFHGSLKDVLSQFDYMVSSVSPTANWTWTPDVTDLCPNSFRPHITFSATWRPHSSSPAPTERSRTTSWI